MMTNNVMFEDNVIIASSREVVFSERWTLDNGKCFSFVFGLH